MSYITPGNLFLYHLYHLSGLHIEAGRIVGQGYYSHKRITVMSLGPEVVLMSIMDHTMKTRMCWVSNETQPSPPPSPRRDRVVSMFAGEAHVSFRWIVMCF